MRIRRGLSSRCVYLEGIRSALSYAKFLAYNLISHNRSIWIIQCSRYFALLTTSYTSRILIDHSLSHNGVGTPSTPPLSGTYMGDDDVILVSVQSPITISPSNGPSRIAT